MVFFPVGESGDAVTQIAVARRLCSSCPVREYCLEFSLHTHQDHGVWGGHTEEERRVIRRMRRNAARRVATRAEPRADVALTVRAEHEGGTIPIRDGFTSLAQGA